MLYRAGLPSEMIKTDWDMGYKHITVCCEDHLLHEFGVISIVWKDAGFLVDTLPYVQREKLWGSSTTCVPGLGR